LSSFYCKCVNIQESQYYTDYINPRNKQKSQYGRCTHCRKAYLIHDGEELTGRKAKQIWLKIKHKLRQNTSKYDRYRAKTVLKDGFTYLISATKHYKGDIIYYQIEKRYISGYSTGRTTLKDLRIS